MNFFRREKVITVSDSRQKEKIQEIFAEHNIAYKIKVKETLQRNVIDAARLGSMGKDRMKFQYSFYVDKSDRDLARHLAAIR